MNPPDTTSKHCPSCGETKRLSQFSRRSGWCKPCNNEASKERAARRRAEMGDEAWRALCAEQTRQSRSKPDVRQRSRLITNARASALARLANMYPRAYDALLREERAARGLNPESQRPLTRGRRSS